MPPPGERAIDIDFEHRIHLVGVRIEPTKAKRGDPVAITFRWRCDSPPGEGWQVFTHATDETSRSDNLDYLGLLRKPDAPFHQVDGPDRWKAGTTYTETLRYVIPEWAKGKMTVYVGFWKGAARLHVVSGPTDGEDRGIAGTIDID